MRSRGQNAQDWQDEDPFDDTSFHAPGRASESLQKRTTESKEERVPNQMEEVLSTRVGQQERTESHPLTVPTGCPYLILI
jgi:hypothetical protein